MRRAVCSILPPHVFKEISRRGSPAQRLRALETLIATEQLRGRRIALAALPAPVPPGEKHRSVYDGENGTRLPGTLVRGEGSRPVKDPAVNEAYDGAGTTYDFYAGIYSRNSIDDRGMRIDSTVHYDVDYDNAFWNGDQMVYGDGEDPSSRYGSTTEEKIRGPTRVVRQ